LGGEKKEEDRNGVAGSAVPVETVKPSLPFASSMNPDLRAFLANVPGCKFLFQPDFYQACGEVIALGPDENTRKSVMGRYFPGRALPPCSEAPNQLDMRFQPPVKPNALVKKWAKIARYRVGLIVGPSGSGKVCLFIVFSSILLPHFFFSLLPVRLQPFLIFLHLNASGVCMQSR
jgi:hypothetical protein